MSDFRAILPPVESRRPRSNWIAAQRRKDYIFTLLKDQFAFTSILAIGALLISLLHLAIGSKAFFLAPLLLGVRVVDALLQTWGLKKNPYMEHVLKGPKMSGQYPNASTGLFGNNPADGQVVVFMIGARNNHPLGLFADGWKELGDYFKRMVSEIEKNAEEYGYLGAQGWTADGERATSNETMTVMFFKSPEGIHKYAHGQLHKEGWQWWNKTESKHAHIGIWHEIFVAPKGMWETIYINSQPLGFGSSYFPIKGKDGETVWQNPLVDASRGKLRTSRGRMTMTDGTEHEKYDFDLYSGRV